MDEQIHDAPAVRKSVRTKAAAIFAVGLLVGVVAAGFTVATAQTAEPSKAPSTGEKARLFGKRGHHGGFGLGKGAIHGEFTTRARDGGFQRLATQLGEVTAVGASSITVESADDFRRTYVVNDDTMVNAGNEGTEDIKKGDTVRVIAVIDGDEARAVNIHDRTQAKRLRGKWMPTRPVDPESQKS